MNKTKIFETVKQHLLKQKVKAQGPAGEYTYQNDFGLRCAIGCLIPDDHPGLAFGNWVSALLEEHPDLAELWEVDDEDDVIFLRDLQDIHDSLYPSEWADELNRFESRYVSSS